MSTCTKTCRYWLNGGCHNPHCLFLHPAHGTVSTHCIAKSSTPCHFFLKGKCNKGTECSFMHAPPPQQNPSLTRSNNPEVNAKPPPQQQINSTPCSSDDSSDVSFDVIVGSDWHPPIYDFLCQQHEMGWYENYEYYSSPEAESTLRRPGPPGMKRPLEEQEVGSKPTKELRDMKQRRLNDEGQNGNKSCGGVLSSRLRGRITLPEMSTSRPTFHIFPLGGFVNGNYGINAPNFPPPKSLAELKRAKAGMELDFEGPKSLSVLLKKKRET